MSRCLHKNIPDICALAEKAAAQLKQHLLTNQYPQDRRKRRPRIVDGIIMRGRSFEQLWNNMIAQTHTQAVKLGYLGDIDRWRDFVCYIYVQNECTEIEMEAAEAATRIAVLKLRKNLDLLTRTSLSLSP